MAKKRDIKLIVWRILAIFIALGTIGYLALPFLRY
jgi:hypothetical protein